MYEQLVAAIADVAQGKYLVPLTLGTLAGIVGGALPGVTITMTIFVALPFTFGNDPLLGTPRLTLGIPFLEGGVDFLPVLIGVFAFSQIMSEVEEKGGVERM